MWQFRGLPYHRCCLTALLSALGSWSCLWCSDGNLHHLEITLVRRPVVLLFLVTAGIEKKPHTNQNWTEVWYVFVFFLKSRKQWVLERLVKRKTSFCTLAVSLGGRRNVQLQSSYIWVLNVGLSILLEINLTVIVIFNSLFFFRLKYWKIVFVFMHMWVVLGLCCASLFHFQFRSILFEVKSCSLYLRYEQPTHLVWKWDFFSHYFNKVF